MPDRPTFFSGGYIERQAERRADRAGLIGILAQPGARVVPVWNTQCLVGPAGMHTVAFTEVERFVADPRELTYLGARGDEHFFALSLPADAEPPAFAGASFVGLRETFSRLAPADASLLAYARAMVTWQHRHRYCGLCGSPNEPAQGGFVMVCSRADCGHRSFPRLDPAVIVLTTRADRCLLGRQPSWPEHRFSTIAGFVEPGESLEDAIRREVAEETDVRVGSCRYVASQPWPFPAAIMLGFHAEAVSSEIRLNDGELAEASWFTRDELVSGEVLLPSSISIAFRLIQAWFDEGSDRPLSDFPAERVPTWDARPVKPRNA